ncbi:hypothetical protein CRE_07025 [Caenorhabditis remanei]|uniref:Serpentine receptor class r-10 n=1 Tax=Caenorhabditis remanei TaxID=31234 RepID=E3NEG9_CAERE|nr:hypothetical protein CRE_07025 [Caenorhabditis remanei]
MSWDSFHIVFIRCCGVAALLTNTLMFHLICYKSPKNLGAYKYLMMYFAIFEGQYAILDMIALPDSITLRSALLTVVSSKKNHMPEVLLPVFNVLYWTSYGMSLALIDVHFVFRYLVVSGNKIWTSSHPSKLFLWLFYPILFGGLHAAGCRYFAGPTHESTQFYKEVLFNGSEIDTNEVDIMGFYIYPKDINGKQQINWMNVAELIEKTVEISFSGTIMCVFGMKCYKKIESLNSKKTRSNRYQSVQKQLFLALVLQTIIPLVLMYIPSGIIIIFCIADWSVELFGRIICITIALYPVLDPLPNMFVINTFRNALFKYCKKIFCLKGKNNKEQETTGTATKKYFPRGYIFVQYLYRKLTHPLHMSTALSHSVQLICQMSWDSFHIVFLRCCGIAALLTNTLMFHLICYKSPKNLGVYKYLMMYFAVFEGLYALLDMTILPDSYTLQSAFLIVISSRKSHMPEVLLQVFNVLYWTSYGMSLALIDVHFVFRYLVVSGEVLFNGSEIDTNEVDIMGFYVYPRDIHGKQQINWMNVAGMVENTVEISFYGTIMCVFGIKCYQEIENLNSMKTRSNQYQSVQKQLFLALVLQTIIPLVLMYIPGGFITIFCIADWSIEIFGRILCITIALYPVLDPLPNMFVINTFRHAIFKYCKKIFCLKGKKNKEQPNGTGTQITSWR